MKMTGFKYETISTQAKVCLIATYIEISGLRFSLTRDHVCDYHKIKK